MSENSNQQNNDMERRELLKGLATVPVLGLFIVNLWQKIRRDTLKKSNILSNLVQEKSAPAVVKGLSDSRHLNIGIIGYGGRGSHLIRGAGFATKGWTDTVSENARKNKLDKQFATFMSQEDLNCSLVGVCDLFDVNAELAMNASQNEV
ncbi:MAG: gfo/Idh/MocA family oxidoreductase, partial [Candidatus Neomarinimicrobiota bacterium]|nr:gfo/Idh/MocA family oxidoreductase [Candidatus Neomarinimicrobiota bacterium]